MQTIISQWKNSSAREGQSVILEPISVLEKARKPEKKKVAHFRISSVIELLIVLILLKLILQIT